MIQVRKPYYYVLYPWKFTSFIWNYLELDEMSEYCDVEVLSMSYLYDKKFESKLENDELINDKVIKIKSYIELIKKYLEIKKNSKNINVCISNQIGSGSFFSILNEILIYFIFKNSSVKILLTKNTGLPIYYNNIFIKKNYFINNFKKFTNINEVFKKISIIFYTKFESIIKLPYVTHVLVAGKEYENQAKSTFKSSKIKLIYGHCQDYSNAYLKLKKNPSITSSNYSTLLDAAEPMYSSDYNFAKRKLYLTSEIWYPTLCNFFKKIEDKFTTTIKIAGHYKSKHNFNKNCFDNREVYYNQTFDLVQNSNFILTRYSSAISYAILFKKPIIFIYSNQLLNDKIAMNHIFGFSNILGTTPINIDNLPNDLNPYLLVNEDLYINYEFQFLSSNKSKITNTSIIYNEIIIK